MIVTPAQVKAYAHCQNPLCPGYGQEEVDAVRTEFAWTFGDSDPKSVFKNMIDRSTMMFEYANGEDRACRSCSTDRELTGTARPTYQALSGFDPMGLLNAKFDPNTVNTEADARIAALEAALAKQTALIEGMLARTEDV